MADYPNFKNEADLFAYWQEKKLAPDQAMSNYCSRNKIDGEQVERLQRIVRYARWLEQAAIRKGTST